MSKTTIITISKNKGSIINAFENFRSKTQKIKTTPHEDIDKELITISINLNIPITGVLFKRKQKTSQNS